MVTVLEGIGGALLCALIVATPWMYGTTEAWSVRLMNIGSFSAGAFLLAGAIVKWFGRRNSDAVEENSGSRSQRSLKVLFLALNLAVLAYCAVALWNYRATFSVQERSFDYREDYQRSLPTTYDAGLTRDTLINLAAFFRALLGTALLAFPGPRAAKGRSLARLAKQALPNASLADLSERLRHRSPGYSPAAQRQREAPLDPRIMVGCSACLFRSVLLPRQCR